MGDDLRIGLVGCGRLAEVGYVPALHAAHGVHLIAVAEPNPARRTRVATLVGGVPESPEVTDVRRAAVSPERAEFDLALGINGYQLAEEVVKHYIINNDSSHNGWVQSERMERNAQNVDPQVSSFTGALHGTVKWPALVIQGLSAAAVMLRFTEQFLAVFAHNIAPQIKIVQHASRSDA